jgi:hypothetical protein
METFPAHLRTGGKHAKREAMTHAQMLAALTRELVRMEIRMEKQNPEMVLGMAMARRVMERMYENAALKGEI